jgi:hypothetical protein
MAKIFGGSASRLEVYALFAAAVVLIGGGVAGAVVVTSSDSSPAPVAVAEATTTTAAAVTTIQVAPGATPSPPVQAPRQAAPSTSIYQDPTPVTVSPAQPVQDFSAYCTMPAINGIYDEDMSGPVYWRAVDYVDLFSPTTCPRGLITGVGFCIDSNLVDNQFRILSQSPAAGTLVHRSLGSISYVIAANSVGSGHTGSNNPC